MEFFHQALAPFSVALMILGLIALLEVGGLLFGVAFSGIVDSILPDFDFDGDLDLGDIDGADMDAPDVAGAGPVVHFLSWLCVGKVPVLILLAAFLMGFGVSGLVLQNFTHGILGFYLPAVVAAMAALIAALPLTRYIGLGIARILPGDTTDAVSSDSFIGRTALIVRGTAQKGAPAEAKLKDGRGTTQYVLVEPDTEEGAFSQGSEVLLTEKSGAIFRAILNENAALTEN